MRLIVESRLLSFALEFLEPRDQELLFVSNTGGDFDPAIEADDDDTDEDPEDRFGFHPTGRR